MADTEGIAKASRHFNVSQTSLYKWKQKLESLGESALESRGGDQLSKQNAQLLRENRMLKQIIAEKELQLMIQQALLKKVHNHRGQAYGCPTIYRWWLSG